MYQRKRGDYAVIAFLYYILLVAGFIAIGVLMKVDMKWYYILYISLILIAVAIVAIKDKSLFNLGISKENLFPDLVIALILFAGEWLIRVMRQDASAAKLFSNAIYHFFLIALSEELMFRGLIQNYLFGLKINKYLIFVIGAVMFSFLHIPFQMIAHNNISFDYVISAIPQLITTFICHLVFCFIADKRKNIYLVIALHFTMNYFINA